ncbi:MAG TPA: AgmX/PglI C-terminal domain-containing protein [Polyangia bacterium]|nr:AgmX/PglI C-terminal domain-containing protein [Polyangia bacterium]
MGPSPSTAERRLLRVGIIHSGRVVEERVVAHPGDITIGTSPRSTFIVPWDEAPRLWRLIEARGGRRFLHLAGNMTARIADGAAVTNVDARGGAATGARPIPLADRARGKVTLGETTVLFQLVRPPPPRPRPRLPSSIRRRLMTEVDRLFAVVLALTALLHVAVVFYLRQVDWPRRPELEEIPDRFIHQMARARPPTPPPAAPATVAAPGSEASHRPHPAVSATARPARAPVKTHAELETEVRRMGLIPLLTARGPDGHAALPDLLANGAVDRALDEALRDVGGVTVASSDGLRGLPRPGSGSGKVGVPTDLRGGTRIVDARPSGPVGERDVASRLKVAPPVAEGGHADLASITREIRARRKAIAACYERALKQTPTLAGKLLVRFTLTGAGTVSAVDIDDDTLGAPEVGACVRALVLRWRFAPPAEAPVELTFPFVFQAGG